MTDPSLSEHWRDAIVAALENLEAARERGASHEARKSAKRARALARLAPASLHALARSTQHAASAARRALGETRDAEVRRQTLAALEPHAPGAGAAFAAMLERNGPQASAPSQSASAFEALAAEWRAIDASGIAVSDLVEATQKVYRRGRKRLKQAADGETDDLHRLRRSAVDLQYQVFLLAAHAPKLGDIYAAAKSARDALGEVNDIDVLMVHLDALAPQRYEAFAKPFRRRRKDLLKRAMKAAERLFAEKPSAFGARIEKGLR
ncbi:MAG: CHAD domain-containing protein [Hyphomicrobiales bacterium]|nr:CHAD domain-containing protein [Hyphomicrobiales bacterium]